MSTRGRSTSQPVKSISFAKYAEMREDIKCKLFKIFPDGTSGYWIDGALISAEDFNRANQLPASLIANNSDNSDRTKHYLRA